MAQLRRESWSDDPAETSSAECTCDVVTVGSLQGDEPIATYTRRDSACPVHGEDA